MFSDQQQTVDVVDPESWLVFRQEPSRQEQHITRLAGGADRKTKFKETSRDGLLVNAVEC